ncbi:hypothetical protein BGZ94_008194 [Podila epigama]|nr:hypothetical protein BGZ94_008194 [Podila epigama]
MPGIPVFSHQSKTPQQQRYPMYLAFNVSPKGSSGVQHPQTSSLMLPLKLFRREIQAQARVPRPLRWNDTIQPQEEARQQEEAERQRQAHEAAAQATQQGQPQMQEGTREHSIALLQRQIVMRLQYMEDQLEVGAASAHTEEAEAWFLNQYVAVQQLARVLHLDLARYHEP